MEHNEKSGAPKLKRECSLPLTGKGVVDLVITELGVFEVDRKGQQLPRLIELADGVELAEVRSRTEAEFDVVLR
jgi:acyl CoA:acetate/3-ketoacid CoA transferase beta subunit